MTAERASSDVQRGARRWLLREIVGCIMVGVLLFVAAGTVDWSMGWALVALYAVWVAANALLLMIDSAWVSCRDPHRRAILAPYATALARRL